MRAVERRRAPLSVPAETRDVDPPLASRIRSFVVYLLQTGGCFTVMARAMENRAQIEAKTSLVARYTVGMENTVYGTERFGCMLQQSPAAPIPREFRASSGQRPYLEPSRESSPRMHVSPREEHDADCPIIGDIAYARKSPCSGSSLAGLISLQSSSKSNLPRFGISEEIYLDNGNVPVS